MTENPEKDAPDSPPAVPEIDWFLQFQAKMVKVYGLPVTLTVNGLVISGTIVSQSDFIKDFSAKLGDGLGETLKDEGIRETIRQTYTLMTDKITETPEDERPDPLLIHLRDVRFYPSSQAPVPNSDGLWWRGKLSDVSGFSLGKMEWSEK